ncbi:MAG: hypothetical protein JW784_01540, partial [Candidatus Cloacimonetes bacterium]|nr:hypothetical protein [Candidatus Cloacimonadota bacterium]
PRLSVELNASFNLKLNPGAVTSSFLRRFQSESFLLVTENSTASRKLQLYLLNPDYLQNEDYTLYGRTDFIQNIWWDIISQKLSLLYTYEKDKSVDQRYNDKLESRLLEYHELTLKLLSWGSANLELNAENRRERESRFKLDSEIYSWGTDLQYQVDNNLTLTTGIVLSQEEGSEFTAQNDFRLKSLTFSENVTYFLGTKYRFNARLSLRNNRREGSMTTSYSDRLDGDILKWNLNANYRLNRYTYAFFEYRGEKFPGRDRLHQLKLEIRAEF